MANMHEDRKLLEAPIRGGSLAYLCMCRLLINVVPDKRGISKVHATYLLLSQKKHGERHCIY